MYTAGFLMDFTPLDKPRDRRSIRTQLFMLSSYSATPSAEPVQFMFPPILKFVPGFGESFCLAPKGKLKNTAFVYRFLAAAGLNSLQIVSFVSANTGRPERRTRSQKTEFEE